MKESVTYAGRLHLGASPQSSDYPRTSVQAIDIEYNKRLDHRRQCLEDDLTAGSNL